MAPILFCNIAWMKDYKGVRGDTPIGGGSYVTENGTGSERHNFNYKDGVARGFVQVYDSINIQRLGASNESNELKNVTVIWVANSIFGTVIVGWYLNATVLKIKEAIIDSRFRDRDFNIIAKPKNCHLLPVGRRIYKIPRGRNGMGRSNVWYADNKSKNFLNKIQTYINSGGNLIKKNKNSPHGFTTGWNSDPLLRKKIEDIAILKVSKHFSSLGYTVNSCEKDNVGWDLQAHLSSNEFLRLEVKGLSGRSILVELTPNEFSKMKKHHKTYQLCVVTNTLGDPYLSVFSHSEDQNKWQDENGHTLKIKPFTGARMKLV